MTPELVPNITCVDASGKQVPIQAFSGGFGGTVALNPNPPTDTTYVVSSFVTPPSPQLEFPFVQLITAP